MTVKLAEYDWIFVNNLSYRIHAISDFAQMRTDFLKYLDLAIHYDKAFWGLVDKARTPRIYDVINIGYTDESLQSYVENPISDEPIRIISSSSNSYLYRGMDLYSSEAEWEQSEYYQKFSGLNRAYYIMVLGLVFDQKQISTLTLARERSSGNFSERDIAILNLLKDHLALRVSRELSAPAAKSAMSNKDVALRLFCLDKGLTKRETEVIQCIHHGDTTEEICQNLFISQTTLKKHITNAYHKLGIKSRGQINKLLQ